MNISCETRRKKLVSPVQTHRLHCQFFGTLCLWLSPERTSRVNVRIRILECSIQKGMILSLATENLIRMNLMIVTLSRTKWWSWLNLRYRHSQILDTSYVPGCLTQLEVCASRKWQYIWSRIYVVCTYIQRRTQFKSKFHHAALRLHRFCYRPAVLFRHFRLITLLLSQGKIHPAVLKRFYFSFLLFLKLRNFNPLKTKRRPLYLKTQSVPRCKQFSSRL